MLCDHVHTVREIVVKKKKSCYSTVRLDRWQNEATDRLKCPCVPPVWLFWLSFAVLQIDVLTDTRVQSYFLMYILSDMLRCLE